MENNGKALRRGLFGVRSDDVQQLLADRDVTALAAAEQVRIAEERASTAETRAKALESQLAEIAQAPPAPERADSPDPHQLLMAVREEMARVMHATQEAGSKILEFTRSDVEQQLEDSDRRSREVDQDRARLAAWIVELQESSVGLRQEVVDAAAVLNRSMGALQEAERAVARMVGRMAETDGVIQRFQSSMPRGPEAETSATATPADHSPAAAGAAAHGNGYTAPEPPVEVSFQPAAAVAPPDDMRTNGEHEDSGDADMAPAPPAAGEENGNHVPEGALTPAWSAGPAGRRPRVTGD